MDAQPQDLSLDPAALHRAWQALHVGSIGGTGVTMEPAMQQAVQAASEAFGAGLDEIGDALVLDVRRAGVFDQARTMIPGARWCDPATVSTWAAELPAGRSVVVYCVYGHEVSRVTAMQLRAAGWNARYLRGGMDGWRAAGGPVAHKAARSTP